MHCQHKNKVTSQSSCYHDPLKRKERNAAPFFLSFFRYRFPESPFPSLLPLSLSAEVLVGTEVIVAAPLELEPTQLHVRVQGVGLLRGLEVRQGGRRRRGGGSLLLLGLPYARLHLLGVAGDAGQLLLHGGVVVLRQVVALAAGKPLAQLQALALGRLQQRLALRDGLIEGGRGRG